MRKLILKCDLSLGDIVLLTAAVRDLHRWYPGQFVTDVRTFFPELWEHNPSITPIADNDAEAELIRCSYPLIDYSNRTPYHCIHGFIEFLNSKLEIRMKPTEFKGDVHLSAQEKAWYSQVHELTGKPIPFWIVAAGGKYDLTIKWWQRSRYQEVVDSLQGRIQFVQVGAKGDYHPRLQGAIDLRGQTSVRQLIRLVYHAQGVLCSVTGLMHLAAAVEPKARGRGPRPCVVIAGGREPEHWEAYPGHQFIHTIGALACCRKGGCWKDRVVPLRDGDPRDRPANLCVNVVNEIPRCMDLIAPAEVVRRIQLYFLGGQARYLTAAEKRAAEAGVIASCQNAYDDQSLNIHTAGMACDRYLRSIPDFPGGFAGRGIVICGGGVRYFTSAWVCINLLRDLGCRLPIEFWYLGSKEMSPAMISLLEPLGVRCVDALRVRRRFPARRLQGWELKPYAMLHSSFRDVLLLDADNVPLVDPEFLFDTVEFKKAGAVFWPDYAFPKNKKTKTIWHSCGLRQPKEREFETGQILVDKERCWRALKLSMWFNEHSDFYYKYQHGDKETFHLAFRKVKQSYALVKTRVESLEGTMCQHDFAGRRIFQHRNSDKWDLFLRNREIKGFQLDKECRRHILRLQKLWDGGSDFFSRALPRRPPARRADSIKLEAIMVSQEGRAPLRNRTIKNLAKTDWNETPLHIKLWKTDSADVRMRQNDCMYCALKEALLRSSEYFLLIEDDLDFNRFIRHNIGNWEPLRAGQVRLASLYNPSIREMACDLETNARFVDPKSVFGSQAFLLSRETVDFLVRHWNKVEARHDVRMSRLAGRLTPAILYHAPSLVQHIDPVTEIGGIYDRAMDFDASWKATQASANGEQRQSETIAWASASYPGTDQNRPPHYDVRTRPAGE